MVNIDGNLIAEDTASIALNNRGYAYGDALFETIRVNSGKILFWEEHYFRLMASMRILRMKIPMKFTPEFLEKEILNLIEINEVSNKSARIKITVHRVAEGLYTPINESIGYSITFKTIENPFYTIDDTKLNEITLFKDHYIQEGLLSNLKTNNRTINVLGSIFTKENGFQNAILLNSKKMVAEALNGNLFIVKGNVIKTPPRTDGCINGIMKSQLIQLIQKLPDYELEEKTISPFELQKADELFVTNVIQGIVPVTKFRKKEFKKDTSRKLLGTLNAKIRLS